MRLRIRNGRARLRSAESPPGQYPRRLSKALGGMRRHVESLAKSDPEQLKRYMGILDQLSQLAGAGDAKKWSAFEDKIFDDDYFGTDIYDIATNMATVENPDLHEEPIGKYWTPVRDKMRKMIQQFVPNEKKLVTQYMKGLDPKAQARQVNEFVQKAVGREGRLVALPERKGSKWVVRIHGTVGDPDARAKGRDAAIKALKAKGFKTFRLVPKHEAVIIPLPLEGKLP